MKRLRLLITGVSGFVAFHLADYLSRHEEYEIWGLDLNDRGAVDLPNVRWWTCNLSDAPAITKLVQETDGVINLGGVSRLGDGFLYPYECMLSNTIGAMNVLEAARSCERKPWVILGSTREVQDIRFPSGHVYFQNAPGMYGLSKLCTELLAERYAQDYKMKVMSIRLSDVYGSIRDNHDRVLPKFILRTLRNEDLMVSSNPNGRDFTYISDAVAGLTKAIEFMVKQTNPEYEVATICTGRATTLLDLAEIIVRESKQKINISILAQKEDQIRNSPLQNNTERARLLLGFKAAVSLEEGILRTIADYRLCLTKPLSQLSV